MDVTITITGISALVVGDLHQRWLDKHGHAVAKIVGPIDAASTSVTFSQSDLSAQADLPAVGDTVLIGAEPCSVTGYSGNVATVTRTAPVAHTDGEPVRILAYPTTYEMLHQEALLPYVRGEAQALGPRSLTFGGVVTGRANP